MIWSLIVILLTSCEKEIPVVELQEVHNVEQKSTPAVDFNAQLLGDSLMDYVPQGKQNAYVVAKLLNLAVRSNPNVLEAIQKATIKQFDIPYLIRSIFI